MVIFHSYVTLPEGKFSELFRLPTEPRLTSRLAGAGLIAQFESAGVGAEKKRLGGLPFTSLDSFN